MKVLHIHWLKPLLMIGSLLAGALFALGHHLFYNHLDGKDASSSAVVSFFGNDLSWQQTNTSIGTAFAFLVKAFLAAAISIAYVQVFWKFLHNDRSSAGVRLSSLNTTSAGLDDPSAFLNLKAWMRNPAMLFLAVISWLIPVAAIISPATLSVAAAAAHPPPSSLLHVPNLDFSSFSFVAELPLLDLPKADTYLYNGPSSSVLEVATAVAAQGAILPIEAPGVNASWSLSFHGPSLHCENITNDLEQQISANIRSYLLSGTNHDNCNQPYGYLAWFPRQPSTSNSSALDKMPLVNVSGIPTADKGSLADLNNGQEVTLYIWSMSALFQTTSQATHTNPVSCEILDSGQTEWEHWEANATQLQCQLVNSTYHVDFTYPDGLQTINVSTSLVDPANVVTTANTILGPSLADSPPCPTFSLEETCDFNRTLLASLSYQAIMDAFSQSLLGSISIKGGNNVDLNLNVNSTVMSTSLVNTVDLSFLQDYAADVFSGQITSIQSELESINSSSTYGLQNSFSTAHNQTLANALEELFRNTVVSMMSSPALQPNTSSATAPPPSTVTFHRLQNVYVYTAWKLWLPYGIAIALTAIAVAIGLQTMLETGVSYSYDFSTIFRISRGLVADVAIKGNDIAGADPLPEYLGNARLRPIHYAGAQDNGTNAFLNGFADEPVD